MFRHRRNCLEGPLAHALGDSPAKETLACHIRSELVQQIRREIAEGRYETPAKWEAALEVLFRQLQDAQPTS
jgi:hypothetical protein